MVDISLPNINGRTDSEQLAQIKNYLYQIIPQLQLALNNGVLSGGSYVVPEQSKAFGSGTQIESPTSNFNELKSLIIKSADFVESMYAEISGLIEASNRYVAKSEFGTFEEETNNALFADGTGLTQIIKSNQTIYDENGNVRTGVVVNGSVYSGIIEYASTGEAIVGIEIGQSTKVNGQETFNKFARFTADRLSFYDANSVEVAYISDYKLVITNAWVKEDLEIGNDDSRFIFDASDGLALIPM